MKFQCPECKDIISRDMRNKLNKIILTKRGFRSYCERAGRTVYCKPLKELENDR